MNTQVYHDLKAMLFRELEEITRKGELTAGSLETVDKLTHSIKSIDTILAMHGERSEKRDAMGRYSREDARDNMIHELREMMHTAPEDTKGRFRSFIRELENA